MSSLATCDVGAVERAASVLTECAELTVDADAACRRARGATWRWRGPASRRFDASLDRMRHQLAAVESAHREAGDAVRTYAVALAFALDTARRADALAAQADEASGGFRRAAAAVPGGLAGPDPGEALRSQAEQLQQEARDQEEIAASLAAGTLDALTDRAPAAPRLAGGERFVHDFGCAVGGSLVSLVQLVVVAGKAVGVGGDEGAARHELWVTAKDSVQVWEPFDDMWHDVTGGRSGSALGAAAGMFLTRKQRLAEKTRLHDPHLAHREALREVDLRALLADVVVTRQTAEEMGRNGVSLLVEEKRGGHVIDKHVAASRAYLLSRNRAGWRKAGTFRDVPSAQELVNAVLREHAAELPKVYGLRPNQTLVLRSSFPFSTGRVTVTGSSRTVAARAVTVVLRLEGGQPHVYSAFPEL